MYRNVVVLLDGSELAEGVLPHVAEVVRDRGSQVHLLSVSPLGRGIAPAVADVRPTSTSVEERQRIEQELKDYLRTVAERLESLATVVERVEPFGHSDIERAVRSLADEFGLKAGDLIHPCRVALTGGAVSPDIFAVIQLIGRDKSVERLRAAARAVAGASPGASAR